MKILALIGSPRQEGNTDLLVEQILEGSKTKGHTTKKLYLYDYAISLCTDCTCTYPIPPVRTANIATAMKLA